MNARSSLVLSCGFGILIVLIGALGITALQRASIMRSDLELSQASYLATEALCRDLATDMYALGVLVRDYFLDSDPTNLALHRSEIIQKHDSIEQRLDLLLKKISPDQRYRVGRLQEEVEAYWNGLDPIFEWTAAEKAERSRQFLKTVLPHRDAVVNNAQELTLIINNNARKERERLEASQDSLRRFLVGMIAFSLLVGTLVAALTIYKVRVLERLHGKQRKEIEDTQNDLRRLSQRLVQIQEGERRALSRELHDQVGQTMTALGIQLGNIEKAKDDLTFRQRIEDLKRLNAEAMRTVRDLAMGLRPSMLDDIGLEPALQWQGREFSRHTGVPCRVQVEGSLDSLGDRQKTCIYRIVQEALTNCARHAQATDVLVSVATEGGNADVVVRDNGVGFDVSHENGGLGLIGMRERVQALDGNLNILSQAETGTTIRVQIPIGVIA